MGKPVLLHCINSLGIGGAEVLLRNTVELLTEYDHIICYLYEPKDLLPYFEQHTVYCLNHFYWRNIFSTINKLKKIIKKHNVSIVHAHLFESTLIARLACPSNVKFFFTIHNVLSKDAFKVNKLSYYAEKLTYKKQHNIIAVSQLALDDYKEWIGLKGHTTVLYNYIDEKYFNIQFDYFKHINKELRLVAVGNLRYQKNYMLLIKAIGLLKDKRVSLDIYGEGLIRDELQNLITKHEANVRLMGSVKDISKELVKYDAYIMPSIFEGFGIAPMEAVAAGMPVLLSNIPVFREVLNDIPTYFDPHDVNSIANTIRNSFDEWEEMKVRASNGRLTIKEKASKSVYIENLRKIYTDFPRSCLHIIDSLERGGAETLLTNTVIAINKYYPQVKQTVVTLYDEGELVDEIRNIADCHALNLKLFNPIPALFKYKKILDKKKIDVLHSHLLHSTFLSRLAIKSDTKLVSTYHSVFYDPDMVTYAKKEMFFDRLTYRSKYYSIFVSEAVRENIMKHVGIKNNYEVLFNFASSKFQPAYKIGGASQLKIVMVGNLHEIKNHELAINAVAEFKHLPISLDIYGEGHLKNKLEKLIAKTGANVSLKGKIKMTSEILSQYDLFLMTSHHEGMPLSLIEAMQTGLPSLLNEINMLKETAGEAAEYYEYGSLGSLKSKINKIFMDRKILEDLAQNAIVQSRKFSEKAYVERLFQIYKSV